MSDLARFIEHTLLKPDATLADIRRLCEEAVKFQFAAVCIPPLFVREAKRILGDESPVKVATVVGFPMGYSAIAAKSEEIKRAVEDGADDIDAMINVAALKSDNWNHVGNDIASIAMATHMRGRTLKLILECGMLSEDDIRRLADLAVTHRATYLKTGTGYHGFPATTDMVERLRAIAPPSLKIKAAGGIRTAAQATALVKAGADRIGTSSALEIIGVKK